jgi:hypothetical protein
LIKVVCCTDAIESLSRPIASKVGYETPVHRDFAAVIGLRCPATVWSSRRGISDPNVVKAVMPYENVSWSARILCGCDWTEAEEADIQTQDGNHEARQRVMKFHFVLHERLATGTELAQLRSVLKGVANERSEG